MRPEEAKRPTMPIVFVAHGAPLLALDREKGAHLARWAQAMPRPTSILAISPHWQTRDPSIGATERLPLLYDFSGFPPELSAIRYPYTPAPALATRVEALLRGHVQVARSPERSLDHGVWVPLLHMYPEADVPVVQLALPRRSPDELFALGKLLAPLANEGTLICATGSLTHNLRTIELGGHAKVPAWATAFDAWVTDAVARGDFGALVDFRMRAPKVSMAHPTDEHFLPLVIAAGAASARFARATFPVVGFEYGTLSRRCIEFALR